MTISSKTQIIAVLVLLVLWLAALAFAWATVTSGTVIHLGSHSYLRAVPASTPWWQHATLGVTALLVGGYLVARSRGKGEGRDDAERPGGSRTARTPASTQLDASQASSPSSTRRSITISELELIVAKQLQECSPPQQAAFAAYRVPFYAVPMRRFGGLESVLVVAELPGGLLYYEDVEEGFEVGKLENGVLPDAPCQQFELTHVLHQLGF